MINGIIFDLDGVLLSTDHYHYRAWKQLAGKLDVPFDESINMKLRGVSRMESLEIILGTRAKDYSNKQLIAMCDEKNAIYRTLLKELLPSSVGVSVRQVLNTLIEKKFLLAIGSSSKNAGYIMAKTQLLPFFNVVVDGNKIKKSKPDPEVFLLAASELRLPANQCMVIEDAQSGIDAAKAAGMCAVGFGPYARELMGMDYCITSMDEILQII